jgi:hypothetical protein
MEVDTPPPMTRPTAGGPTPTETLQKAFQTIGPITNAADQRIEVKNAWEIIRSALRKWVDQGEAHDARDASGETKDLNEVKA